MANPPQLIQCSQSDFEYCFTAGFLIIRSQKNHVAIQPRHGTLQRNEYRRFAASIPLSSIARARKISILDYRAEGIDAPP